MITFTGKQNKIERQRDRAIGVFKRFAETLSDIAVSFLCILDLFW